MVPSYVVVTTVDVTKSSYSSARTCFRAEKRQIETVVYNFVKVVQFGNCPVYVWVENENWGALS